MTRFIALDAFRGLTIAAMILVNTPGSWSYIYRPLQHAEWHGCTTTDLIFPFFLFIIGSAMCFSLRQCQFQASKPLLLKVLRRTGLMFAIGLALNAFPFTGELSDLRVMGVLQRIALAYGCATIIVLYLDRKGVALFSVGLLIGYWALLYGLGGSEPYSLDGNIVRQVDMALLGQAHLWGGNGVPFDPEGLLSTLPAIVSLLVGFEATRFLIGLSDYRASVMPLLKAGAAAIVFGLLWDLLLPINKSLWTSSYVVFTSGVALITLALFIWIIDVQGRHWLAKPLTIYGLNPLFIYALSWVWVVSYSAFVRLADGQGGTVDGYTWLYGQFLRVANPLNASLAFALVHVLFFWFISLFLYRKRIVIKI